ncbi:beta-galactosidase [Trifolium repens]|nr:beta-galactosidase [Trifolium repens]
MDAEVISAGILREVLEVGELSLHEIRSQIGSTTAHLVHESLHVKNFASRVDVLDDHNAAALRKFCLTYYDIRALILDLALKLDMMRHLGHIPRYQQQIISLQVMKIYAPLAHAVGTNYISLELEDLSFQYLFPYSYLYVDTWLRSQESGVTNAVEVTHDGRAIKIDGKRRVLISGSIHYPRSTPQMWPDLIKKAKEGGLDAIETYVFWNAHEPIRREYDFSGNNDLIRFLKTIQDEGLFAVLRIGPYVCAEWNYGGIPVWVHNLPGVEIRTANKVYMNEMQNFTTLIVNMVQKEKLFASQGGPIILSQIENEYGNVMSVYGDDGKSYIDWCAKMAESFNIGVPWIMCQQPDAPQPMINTCNGWYCHDFEPNNPNSPKMWTENWVGWFKNWGGKDPHRTAEDVAYSVARFFETGGTFQNYYMYHGGTNFGRTAGGPYITTSYDYDAPLDEYGNIAQPKWGHLKELHMVLKSMENSLTNGNISKIDLGNYVKATVYATNHSSSCFLTNTNTTTDATVTFRGNTYNVPAWSVSLLPNCQAEEYNTAKVNVQTSIMVKRKNKAEDEPKGLKWVWRAENVHSALMGKSNVFQHTIVDQKSAANDSSDYLWYMTVYPDF